MIVDDKLINEHTSADQILKQVLVYLRAEWLSKVGKSDELLRFYVKKS